MFLIKLSLTQKRNQLILTNYFAAFPTTNGGRGDNIHRNANKWQMANGYPEIKYAELANLMSLMDDKLRKF